jgi:tetratricopeptide (TPR) repeat protein
MPVKVIYEDDHIRVVHLAGNKPVALATFATYSSAPANNRFLGMKFCKDEGIEAYGFIPKGISMYPSESVLKAIECCAINPAKPIVTYGFCTGSMPALHYAGALNAAGAIAPAPMYAIDPALVPEDNRYITHYVPALHQGRKVELNDMSGNIVLLFDPSEKPDAYNARLIGQDYQGDRLREVHIHHIGHGFLPNVADRQLLLALIDFAAHGGEIGEIDRLARATKKTKHYYGCILAGKLLRHHKPRLAIGVLDAVMRNAGSPPDSTDRLRRAELSARAYMALAMPAAAVSRIEEAIELQPRNPVLFGKLATALDADGRLEPALEAWRTAISYAASEPRLRKHFELAMQRAMRNSAKRKSRPDDHALEHSAAAE